MFVYALTIFTGAFLLFQVQPLIGKFILPWFGGTPGVWTTCMLFFQVLLLGGYAYAHFSASCLKPRIQCLVHLVLLALALATLPIIPADAWKPTGGEEPAIRILLLLTVTLGLPYFVLSSTGPLVQEWFRRTYPDRQTYRLYALSNTGSLLALVSYPFYFESHFTRQAQASLWGWGLATYVAACAICAIRQWPKTAENGRETAPLVAGDSADPTAASGVEPSWGVCLLWVLLPACASILLLATTNKMCQDVAVIPFLWVLPLAIYLLTFIISFDNPCWYARYPYAVALIAATLAVLWALSAGVTISMGKQVAVYAGGLFVFCMVCHGELYRLRPAPRHLTAFYLLIAAGGALGGLFVAVVAPRIFTSFQELSCGLILCAVLFLAICARDVSASNAASHAPNASQGRLNRFLTRWSCWQWMACTLPLVAFGMLDWKVSSLASEVQFIPQGYFIAFRICVWLAVLLLGAHWLLRRDLTKFRYWRLLACVWLGIGVVALGAFLWTRDNTRGPGWQIVHRSRNFYGTLTICEYRCDEPQEHYASMLHGCISHGLQFVDPARRRWPTTYYGEQSGVGLAIHALPPEKRRIGLIGLGTGTLAAYGRPGDEFKIYEINPAVTQLAQTRFTFLRDCPAHVDVVLGDARLSLERESPQRFDLLAIDAFSGDAVPVHLLTREAFEIYDRHMADKGVIAVHISNRFLDLEPVIANVAQQQNYQTARIEFTPPDDQWWLSSSTWILLSRNEEFFKAINATQTADSLQADESKVPLWTDDFASLFQIVK